MESMSQDRKKTGRADTDRVDVDQSQELRGWAAHWHCAQSDIFAAVKAVGVLAKDVEAWLRANGKMR
ncbi:MAG TPA: DUF3606 domain-containing protein [Burkholderiales bacterium]|nr:DUF3606 domain-containing protein [Burkholderiales bacterium]